MMRHGVVGSQTERFHCARAGPRTGIIARARACTRFKGFERLALASGEPCGAGLCSLSLRGRSWVPPCRRSSLAGLETTRLCALLLETYMPPPTAPAGCSRTGGAARQRALRRASAVGLSGCLFTGSIAAALRWCDCACPCALISSERAAAAATAGAEWLCMICSVTHAASHSELGGNELSGTLPETLGALTSLTYLCVRRWARLARPRVLKCSTRQ